MIGRDSLVQPLCDRISLWYSEVINIDAVLPQIQSEREPEIIRAQQLQSQEAAQTELLRKSALLRWGGKPVSTPAGQAREALLAR